MAKPRLGRRQRALLEWLATPGYDGAFVRCYTRGSIPDDVSKGFWMQRDFDRFLEEQSSKGYIDYTRSSFAEITETGMSALAAQPARSAGGTQ